MKKSTWIIFAANGVIAILVGAIIAFYPKSILQIFLISAGVWATILGLFQIVIAPRMQKKVKHHGLFTLNGIITLTFGLLLFYNPSETRVLIFVIGLMAMLAGVGMVYLTLHAVAGLISLIFN